MEILREAAPFVIGMILPPIIMLLIRALGVQRYQALGVFVVALLVGCAVSLWAGELSGSLEDGVMSVIIDTSLVYTGSQLTYRLIWKPLLEERFAKSAVSPAKTPRS